VAADAVRAEFKKAKRPTRASAGEDEIVQDQAPALTREEFGLLQFLFKQEDLVGWAADHLDPAWIGNPLIRRIVTERMHAFRSGAWQGVPWFLNALADPESQNVITEAITRNYFEGVGDAGARADSRDHFRDRPLPNPLEGLKGLVTSLRNQHLTKEIERLTVQMAPLEPGSPPQVDILRQREALKARRKQPLDPIVPPATPSA
jgi:hypothetical protein